MKIKNHKSEVISFLMWLFVSLVAIVIVANNPLLGLLAAGVGGIVFGMFLFK